MREYFITRASIVVLLQNLIEDVRTFLRQEIKLLRKEMSEKASKLGRNAMVLSTGIFLAGAGGILLLVSIGFLLAFAFQSAGLNALLSVFLGFVTIGLLVTIIGAVSCAKGIKAISKVSIVPERTLDAVQSSETSASGSMEPAGAGLHQEVLDTRERIGEEQQELKHRISPLELTKSAIANVRKHPLSWGSAAVACTLTGGYFVGRRIWRN